MKPEANNRLPLRVGPLLPLLVLTFSWQIAASAGALPATVQPAGGVHSLGAAASFTGGLDCLAADDAEDQLLQTSHYPTNLPGEPDQGPSASAYQAKLPSRYGQVTPQTTTTTLDPIALPRPGIVPAFSFPLHSSDPLHELIRERAPPSLI